MSKAELQVRVAGLEQQLRLEKALSAWYLLQLKRAWEQVSRLGAEADNARRRLHNWSVTKRPGKFYEDLN